MLRSRKPAEVEIPSINMTPMIDIVFQLIIFFMLVMDLNRQQVEPINLPSASEAIDPPPDERTLLINVLPNGTVKVAGRTYWRPEDGANNDRLVTLFLAHAERPTHSGAAPPILIRADRSTNFEHLQKLLMIASMHGNVRIVQFGAKLEGGSR